MMSQGYRRSEIDHCLYTKRAKDGNLLILILYVDDMLIASKNRDEIDALKKKLHNNFDMKDMGNASHILGMRVVRDQSKRLLYLCQTEYINKVLDRFNMKGGKALSTPLPSYVKLSSQDSPKIDDEKAQTAHISYSCVVGSLMYAMIATHPDIAFALGAISRYMSNLGKRHWEVVKGILWYLSGTM